MKIKIFTPPKFKRRPLNIDHLNKKTDKKWIYASNGRSSIYHILKDLNFIKILVPVYICDTVLEPLKKLNIEPIFYDLDQEDLNPSLESIKILTKKYDVKVVLVASMYGNPANLIEIEKYCKENSIFMLDDSAQSFGAKLNGRYVGTFGDAGFFSFSPGKPTAGHMGSFFWSSNSITIKRKKQCFLHCIRWLNFYFNRYNIYENNYLRKKIFSFVDRVANKLFSFWNDDLCAFEKDILGGILEANFTEEYFFRNKYLDEFYIKFKDSKNFRVLQPIRGEANIHKIVLIFKERGMVKNFIDFLNSNSIYASNGYRLLEHSEDTPNAKYIEHRVVELPIENSRDKMNYLFVKVKEFEDRNS